MTGTLSDASLAAAFAAGDSSAGDALFARHAGALRAFLAARCRDGDLAGDLLQEVALRLVTAGPRLDPARDVRAYLFQAAANVWRDHLRHEMVRRRGADQLTIAGGRSAPLADGPLLAGELRDAVNRAVAALPATQREVLELRHRQGLRFRDIAERLGRPLGTVLAQMRAALERIDAEVEGYR
jgi:RNA polymerase sigma-70 factor (ECF subfamily)